MGGDAMHIVILLLAGAVAALQAPVAFAQSYPARPVTLVVPASPGGSTDAVGRVFAKFLESRLKQPSIIENRSGAGGYVGGSAVARATADGYTLLFAPDVILYSNLFIKDQRVLSQELLPIAAVGSSPFAIVANAKLGARTMRDFIANVKANPGKYNYGAVGGTTVQLETNSFIRANGLDMVEVPYPDTAGPIRALASNTIQFFWSPITTLRTMLDNGTGVGLAVTSERRQLLAPDIPTTVEQGINVVYYVTIGLFGPLGLPREIVDQLNRHTNDIISSADGQAMLAKFGYEGVSMNSAEMARQIAASSKRYAEIALQIGLKPQ
jgi:tripartite-type tricarboxylate transporter receptor subunit TctC